MACFAFLSILLFFVSGNSFLAKLNFALIVNVLNRKYDVSVTLSCFCTLIHIDVLIIYW